MSQFLPGILGSVVFQLALLLVCYIISFHIYKVSPFRFLRFTHSYVTQKNNKILRYFEFYTSSCSQILISLSSKSLNFQPLICTLYSANFVIQHAEKEDLDQRKYILIVGVVWLRDVNCFSLKHKNFPFL